MERKIKLSVVVPVYNTEEYLGRCLDSLYLQKFRDIEYILVDDGSKDGSLALCQKYAEKDNRFVVISKENGGPSSARNLAISKARGEYITFVDSDDFVRVDAYEKINEILNNNENPDILVFGANLVPEYAPQYLWDKVSPRNVVYHNFEPKVLFNEVGARPFLWLQVIKKDIIAKNNIKMDESINLGEDQLFQIEVFPFCKKIVFISDKFYYYRWKRDKSLMNQYEDERLTKLLLHVGLIKKVFGSIFSDNYNEEMKKETLVWSIFFMYGDLATLLEEEQQKVALELVKVWKSVNYEKLINKLDIWGRFRINQIMLMAESDRDKRIEMFEKANSQLEEELKALKETPEYIAVRKKLNKKTSLIRKGLASLKTNGIKQTLKKVILKLKTK